MLNIIKSLIFTLLVLSTSSFAKGSYNSIPGYSGGFTGCPRSIKCQYFDTHAHAALSCEVSYHNLPNLNQVSGFKVKSFTTNVANETIFLSKVLYKKTSSKFGTISCVYGTKSHGYVIYNSSSKPYRSRVVKHNWKYKKSGDSECITSGREVKGPDKCSIFMYFRIKRHGFIAIGE